MPQEDMGRHGFPCVCFLVKWMGMAKLGREVAKGAQGVQTGGGQRGWQRT